MKVFHRQIKTIVDNIEEKPMHKHIKMELRFDIRFLYFNCNIFTIFQSCFMYLSNRCTCYRFFLKIIKYFIWILFKFFINYLLYLTKIICFCFVLKISKVFSKNRGQHKITSCYLLTKFNI